MFPKLFPVFAMLLIGCQNEQVTTLKASAGRIDGKASNRCIICRTTDNGKNWYSNDLGLPAKANVWRMVENNGQLLISTEENGLFLSDEGHQDWKAINTNQLPNKDITAIALQGTAIYAAVNREGVFATHDGGQHWALLNKNPLGNDGFIHAIFKVGNEVWLAQKDGLFAMSEAPVNAWRVLMDKTVVTKLEQIGDKVFIGTNQGIAMSSNGGDNWVWLVKERFVNKLLLLDGKLVAIYHEEAPEYSEDLGKTWKPVKDGNPKASELLDAVQAGKAFLSDQDGVYSRWDDRAIDFFALPDHAEIDFLPVGNEVYVWVLSRMDGC